jgi:type II secretory pathway component PulJ
MMEMVVSCIILSFIVAAAGALYTGGQQQQNTAKDYSQVQSDLRASMRTLTRMIRHGFNVVSSVSSGNLSGKSSDTSHLIVTIPQTTGSANINVYFYVSGGTLYYQRDSDMTGTSLMTGVQSLTFTYYQTTRTTSGANATGATTTQVNSTPASATEVQIAMTAVNGPATTTVQSYITLRNSSWLLF